MCRRTSDPGSAPGGGQLCGAGFRGDPAPCGSAGSVNRWLKALSLSDVWGVIEVLTELEN